MEKIEDRANMSIGNVEERKEYRKVIKKSIKKARNEWELRTLEEIRDEKHKWDGVNVVKKKWTPKQARYVDGNGNPIDNSRFAGESANYLANVQWSTPDNSNLEEPVTTRITEQGRNINDNPFTIEELNHTIKK